MRKVPLVLAALPLVLAPLTASPALAGDNASGAGAGCAIPKVATQYDAHRLTVFVSLPATGCAAREHSIFDLDMTVTRMANHWSHDVSDWTVPFRRRRRARISPGAVQPQPVGRARPPERRGRPVQLRSDLPRRRRRAHREP